VASILITKVVLEWHVPIAHKALVPTSHKSIVRTVCKTLYAYCT
jgi:hypothetical protein